MPLVDIGSDDYPRWVWRDAPVTSGSGPRLLRRTFDRIRRARKAFLALRVPERRAYLKSVAPAWKVTYTTRRRT